MILAVMSLRQWIDANEILNREAQTWDIKALRQALNVLELTQIQILLLASDADDMQQFLTWAGTTIKDILFVKPVEKDSEEAYTEALRQAYRQLSPPSIVSFSPYVQQIDEFTHLSFSNPGIMFQHYHAWVDSYLPIHPPQKTIVMCVGEVVKQDRNAAAAALVSILKNKYPDKNQSVVISAMFSLLLEQERGPEGYIYLFKMGFMKESIFDQLMIDYFIKKLDITLTIEEFNQIWQATNPSFPDIQPWLTQIDVQKMRRNGYRFEFMTYSNPKDMRHLLEELQKYDQAYVLAQGDLIGFAGLPLACSFVKQKSTEEMLRDLINETSYSQSYQLAESPKKQSKNPIYYVSSEPLMTEHLEAISQIPNVTVLLGWDGSPIYEWVENSLSNSLDNSNATALV